jgi:WD40 repeat protein
MLKVWDLDRGQERGTLQNYGRWVNHVAVSADATVAVVISNDATLRVWDLENGRERRMLEGHGLIHGLVTGVSLSAHGTVAVSAAEDGTLKVWDVGSGACLVTFSCDAPAICCAVAAGVIAAGDAAGHVHFLALEREELTRHGQAS